MALFGISDIEKGMHQYQGRCVGTDPDGDQVVGNAASDGTFAGDAKSHKGLFTWTAGTGNYAGITGGHSYVNHEPDFRPATEGTYFGYNDNHGSYKLP